MPFSFTKRIASRYLISRRKEAFISIITLISVLGVAIGVVVINLTMAIMTGFEYELKKKVLDADAHVVVKKVAGVINNWEDIKQIITKTDGINSIDGFTYNQALLRTSGNATGVLIRGISKESQSAKQLVNYLEEKDLDKALFNPLPIDQVSEDGQVASVKLPGIVIGQELSLSLGLYPGMTIALLSPQVSASPMGLVPKYKRFVVSQVYKSGLSNYESALVYIDLREAQKFFRMGDGVTGIEVRVNNVDEAPQIAQKILNSLEGIQSFYTQDWTTVNKPLWDAIRLEKKVYFIVLLLIIVMASFSIISTLVLLVLEKRGDIAVLRTLGARRVDIGNIFRLQGAIIGGLGTILGLILGYIACIVLDQYGFPLDERIFPISQVPVRIDLLNFAVVGISSFVICLLATIYPAYRASRLEPASVLRYE